MLIGALSLVIVVCDGTSMNCSRRSTPTGRSTSGIRNTSPGPLTRRSFVRPNRNTTSRAYSLTTRTVRYRSSSSTRMTIATPMIAVSGPRVPSSVPLGRPGRAGTSSLKSTSSVSRRKRRCRGGRVRRVRRLERLHDQDQAVLRDRHGPASRAGWAHCPLRGRSIPRPPRRPSRPGPACGGPRRWRRRSTAPLKPKPGTGSGRRPPRLDGGPQHDEGEQRAERRHDGDDRPRDLHVG